MKMGLINAEITLENPIKARSAPLQVRCLVDTGALYLCIPEHVAIQLGFNVGTPDHVEEITTADGKKHLFPYVGPLRISFKNRTGFVGAVVMGEEVLMGAIPMEDLDVVIIPSTLTIDVNPNSPNIPSAPAKLAFIL